MQNELNKIKEKNIMQGQTYQKYYLFLYKIKRIIQKLNKNKFIFKKYLFKKDLQNP
jgi:hypothetical protein